MRKLATAALAFSAAVFAANYILPSVWAPVCAAALAVLGAVLLAFRRKWLRGLVIALLGMALGLGWFSAHALLTKVPAAELDGKTREITARLLEYPQTYDTYCRALVRLEGDGLPHLDALVYDSGRWLRNAEPGQIVRFTGRLGPADTKYGEAYDAYNARDIYFVIRTKSLILTLDRGFDVRSIPVRIQHAVAGMAARIFPSDVAPYMKALMLGDKSGLYESPGQRLALSRAGFMHVVAVSGMHVAYLAALLQLLFGRTRTSALLSIAFVWLFVLVTGASPSAVRAGIMQSLLLFAPLVRRENDPLTSLSAALALILLLNPYAAASVSLQLSFAAMAGLLCFSQWFRDGLFAFLPANALGRMLEKPMEIMAASLSAMIFTLPLVAIHFGYVSILSPLAGMLALWTVPISFCGAYFSCGLAALVPALGTAAAWLVAWPARFLLLVSRLIARIPFAVIYMQNGLAPLWLLFCYAAFAGFALCRMDRRWKLLLPGVLSAAALAGILLATRLSYERRPGVISVLDVEPGQCITAFAGKSTVMIDCGGLGTLKDAGETAGAYLGACGRKQVDLLILTHLDEDHINGVPMLLEMAEVKQIVVSLPPEAKQGTLEELLADAQTHGTQLLCLREDLDLEIGEIQVSLFAPVADGRDNERCLMTKISLGSYDLLVTGDSSKSAERKLLAGHELTDIELLVAGHHGSKYASSVELLEGIGARTAVISVGYNNYGHPSEETLERLAAYGYTVYRTDRDGNVVVRVGEEYGETQR